MRLAVIKMPSKCFASWASPNWTRPPRRRDKNRSCSDQPQNPPPYLLGVTGHNVKHALGLAIARWAVEVHGGQIVLQSVDGQGSTFSVTLPSSTTSEKNGSEEASI